MAMSGLGRLGLWLHLRGTAQTDAARISLPEGSGPVLIMHVSAGAQRAAAQVEARLISSRPTLRILRLGDDGNSGPGTDIHAARALLDAAKPDAMLLLGTDLPAALIAAADDPGRGTAGRTRRKMGPARRNATPIACQHARGSGDRPGKSQERDKDGRRSVPRRDDRHRGRDP